MKTKKKLVDLVYLDSKELESDLKKDYQSKIDIWLKWMDIKLESTLHTEILIEEQTEYFVLNNFIRNFLAKRLEWIADSVSEPDLRVKYLLALAPFNQHGNIRSLLLHFFQLKESPKHRILKFAYLNTLEREIRILWDVYKIIRTKQTIEIMKCSVSDPNAFSSIFSKDYILELLNTLNDILDLLVKICVKTEYHDKVFNQFPMECFNPESILNRKTKNRYLINGIVLEKFDYRNYFFHIFYKPGVKMFYEGKEVIFKYNYLDFEIIRQEFLINWINNKLAGNPNKNEVYDSYVIGDKTFTQIIEKNPEDELTILKQLPKHVFDDLIAGVNETVEEEYKAPVDTMSERTGEFSKQFLTFEKAKSFSQKTIVALRKYVITLRRKSQQEPDELKISKNTSTEVTTTPQIDFQIKRMKKTDIDFPFFCIDDSKFSQHLRILKSSMRSVKYSVFNFKVRKFLTVLDKRELVKRRVPTPEWAISYLIKETNEDTIYTHFLIIGAEAKKNEKLGKGYGVGIKESYKLNSYFVYGSQKHQANLGSPTEKRFVQGIQFFIYSLSNPLVIQKAIQLADIVIKEKWDQILNSE